MAYIAWNTMHIIRCNGRIQYKYNVGIKGTIFYAFDTMHRIKCKEYNAYNIMYNSVHIIQCKEYNAYDIMNNTVHRIPSKKDN